MPTASCTTYIWWQCHSMIGILNWTLLQWSNAFLMHSFQTDVAKPLLLAPKVRTQWHGSIMVLWLKSTRRLTLIWCRFGVPLIRLASLSRWLLVQCMRGPFTILSMISAFIYTTSQIFNWKWEAHAQKTQINGLTLSAFYPECSNIAAIFWFGLLRRILPVPHMMGGGWWVMAAAVQQLLEHVNITLVILQSSNLIQSQQKTEIENLSVHLMLSVDIELMDSNTEFEDMLPSQYVTLERSWVKIYNIECHICSQSSWGMWSAARFKWPKNATSFKTHAWSFN